MADTKLVFVTGATGAQGGSVARHLLQDSSYSVRALTRRASSDAAQSLRDAGAEVVEGDLEDAGTLQELIQGCDAVFGVTNYWEHFDREKIHGKNLVDAVAAAGVDHFVFSTLPHVNKLTRGEYTVPHFDIKGELEDYTSNKGLNATFVHVAFYYENFIHFFPLQEAEDGSLRFGFPQGDTPLAAVSAADIGGVVKAIFDRPDEYIGKTVGIVGDDLPPAEYAEIMTRHLGRKVSYQYIPRDDFAALGFPGAQDLADMFDYNRTNIPNRKNDLEHSRSLYPDMTSFDRWVQQHTDELNPA